MSGVEGNGKGPGRGGPITMEPVAAPGHHGAPLPPRAEAVPPGSAVPPPVKVIEMEEERLERRRKLVRLAAVLAAAAVVVGLLWARTLLGR